MTTEQFEQCVDEAIAGIPEQFRDSIHNLAFVVEEFPDRYTMQLAGVASPYNLLGFYHGVPMTQRTQYYANVAPDTISIYRRPILAQCKNDEEAREMITRVVRHEIAHYFGIDDDRLVELGAY